MRRLSGAIVAMIMAIAVYFILFWGFDALRILSSPTYGLEDVFRSQVIFGIGRFLGLGPEGLVKLAAVYGALKLTVAGVCAVHVIERIRTMLMGGVADTEILETGLLLGVGLSIAAVAPAVLSQNGDLMREHTIQLMLAGLAAALCIIERSGRKQPVAAADAEAAPAELAVLTERSWYAPWR